MPRTIQTPLDYFTDRIEQSDGCWLWKAYVHPVYGYGYASNNRKRVFAHRFAYELFRGPIPAGMQIDHLCRNRRCVNPSHLEVVTQAENVRRGLKGRLVTHCPRGHAYDDQNTRMYRGRRYCRACHREYQQEIRDAVRSVGAFFQASQQSLLTEAS